MKKLQAVLVLPPGRAGAIADAGLRRWLSRGEITDHGARKGMLHAVCDVLGMTLPDGLAALRFWGQTGERSSAWIAAADPVHLAAHLDHLTLRSLHCKVQLSDLRPLFDHLQTTVGSDEYAFARIGQYAYVRGDEPFATAAISSIPIDGLPPDEFLPTGEEASRFDSLLSEVQMALHEHEVNTHREYIGQMPVNSLWIWGGGVAPEEATQATLPLFGDDPLFRGMWYSRNGLVEPWSDGLAACVELAEAGFVAVVPELTKEGAAETPDAHLRELKSLLRSGEVEKATVLFRDGLQVDIKSSDRLRIWRRESEVFSPHE